MTGRRVEARPVLDGQRVKWTLEQVQRSMPGLVRVDWLRFTMPLDAIAPESDDTSSLTPPDLLDARGKDLHLQVLKAANPEFAGMQVCRVGAQKLLSMLPAGFAMGEVAGRGMDFYTTSAVIQREGQEVGRVLAGGGRIGQAGTVHFNLYGSACLHLGRDELLILRDWIASKGGHITRVDLALDRWEGGSVPAIQDAYLAGDFRVRGKQPGQRNAGAWALGHSRTFYVGSRETGKEFRGYEKGDQLFGPEAKDPWVRYEVEIRNNNRIIDLDCLSRPADFFAGSYPFCERMLAEVGAVSQAKKIPTGQRTREKTAEAEVTRVFRWFRNTAAPTVAALLSHCGDAFESVVMNESWRKPGRFNGWTAEEVKQAFESVSARIAPGSASLQAGAA